MELQDWANRWGISPEAMYELGKVLVQRLTPAGDFSAGNIKSEQDVQQKIRLESCAHGLRLWRNNSGAVTTSDGRHVRFGLANDSAKFNEKIKSSDLIGITPIIIKDYHVGRLFGVFTSIEVKRPGWVYKGDPREIAQGDWLNAVRGLGGIAYFATDESILNEINKTR